MNKIKFIFKSIVDLIILSYYKLYFLMKKSKAVDTWLISERGIDARDNGYWFYKYMKENHPEQVVKYVITKNSIDYKKIEQKDVVEYRSKEHYFYFLYAKKLISAEIMGFSPNEQLYYRLNRYGLIKLKGKTVFLQHGITKNFNNYMLQTRTKLDLITCATIKEQKYIVEQYGYSNKVAKLTGFARFDKLVNLDENYILIMPTWRKWLKYNTSLTGTEFYENYMKILNDKDIIEVVKRSNMKIIFYPHIIMQKFLKEFKTSSENVVLASFEEYDVQELLKKSKLLVTDYSSVDFDFAYMRKNVIYYQFDNSKYRSEHYAKGYYDEKKDGFGPVCLEFEDLKGNLLEYLNNNDVFSSYQENFYKFFKNMDQDNCKRIYEEIKKL